MNLSIHTLSALNEKVRIRSLPKFSKRKSPPCLHSALPQTSCSERSTSIDFAEIQLSPTLIGLSPLNSSHPSILPHTRVRPSKECCHYNISLLKFRSAGFGYLTKDFKSPPKTRFLFAFTLTSLSLPFIKIHLPIIQKVGRCFKLASTQTWSFRIFALSQLLFHLSLTVLVHYR